MIHEEIPFQHKLKYETKTQDHNKSFDITVYCITVMETRILSPNISLKGWVKSPMGSTYLASTLLDIFISEFRPHHATGV